MWERQEKKVLYTLCVDNYAPELTEITYPFMEHYAKKIGADFHIISERKFPGFQPAYEKLQIYELAQKFNAEWNLYFDADTFINPDFFDVTRYMPKDTVLHNSLDNAGNRWIYDRFFERDGRHIGSCNWFTVASSWCIELWKPLDDLTYEEAVSRIIPTCFERMCGLTADHLIDDFILSRNIAKYGLKFTTLEKIQHALNDRAAYLWHKYTIPVREKRRQICQTIKMCGAVDCLPPHLQDEVWRVKLDDANTSPPKMPILEPHPDMSFAKEGPSYASDLQPTS